MSIPRKVPYTCGLIDSAKTAINNCILECEKAECINNTEQLRDVLSEINFLLRNLPEDLESIREANIELRDSSEYWKKECENLQHQLDREY